MATVTAQVRHDADSTREIGLRLIRR